MTTINPPVILVTDAAKSRISELIMAEPTRGIMLRMFIEGGGCAGFFYRFRFETSAEPDDHQIDTGAFVLLVDAQSMQYLQGATLDYSEDLMTAGLTVHNPNALSSCGCGSSFSL